MNRKFFLKKFFFYFFLFFLPVALLGTAMSQYAYHNIYQSSNDKTKNKYRQNVRYLTTTLDVLLQTVRSRCIIMNLRSVDTKLIQQYLMQKYQLPDYQARVCAAYAQGNVGKAIMMATSEHFREMQDFLLRLLKRVDDMEVYEIVAAIHDMTAYKMDIRDLIDLMMVWYRDVLILKATEDINQLVYQDEHKYLQKKATTSSYEGLNNIMEALEKAKVRLNANVNFDITMEMLLLTIKEN